MRSELERRLPRRSASENIFVALVPLVGYLGAALAGIMTGSLIVELIFNLPGVGRYFVQGALNRDYPLVMGVVIIYATFIILFNLLSDLAYALRSRPWCRAQRSPG